MLSNVFCFSYLFLLLAYRAYGAYMAQKTNLLGLLGSLGFLSPLSPLSPQLSTYSGVVSVRPDIPFVVGNVSAPLFIVSVPSSRPFGCWLQERRQ